MQPRELDEGRRTVSTKSGEISYIDIGTGPAALFVHGVGTNAYLWRNVIGPLTSVRRCLAIDLPLHGQTPVAAGQDLSVAAMASVLEDFCDALGLTSGTLTIGSGITVEGQTGFIGYNPEIGGTPGNITET